MTNPPIPQRTCSGGKHLNSLKIACHFPQLNSLWSVWYCAVTFSLQIYLVVSNIRLFSSYTILPWPAGTQPYKELNMYVASMGLAVVLLPCFMLAALLKVGNYPNDGTKLEECEVDTVVYQNLKRRRFYHSLKTMWRHSGPTAAFLHMMIAFSLLFPRLFIQAQLIKHGFLNRAYLWKTDLDFLIPHQERITAIGFLSRLNVTDIIQHHENSTSSKANTVHSLQENTVLSVEFLNYTFSLLVYAVRYPSVFWRTSRWFGLLFSVQMIFNTVHLLIVYAGFCILYKVQIYGAQDILLDCTQLLLNAPFSVLLFLGYTCLLVTSGCIVYGYGIQDHSGWKGRHTAGLLLLYSLLLVALIALPVAPLMYDYASVYCGTLDGLMLIGVLGTIAHLTFWILLWIFLTLKISCKSFCQKESEIGYIPNESPISNYKPGKETPLFVIKGGQTYQVREKASKKAILQIVQKSNERERCLSPDDDVYWLRPKMSSHEDKRDGTALFRKHSGTKNRLRFENTNATGTSPKLTAKYKKQNVKFESLSDTSDDGDYAILRDLGADADEQKSRRCIIKKKIPNGFLLIINVTMSLFQVIQEDNRKKATADSPSTHDTTTVTINDVKKDESIGDSKSSVSHHSTSDSSSGVHSPSNGINKRASSMENLATFDTSKPVWKSMSLQRNAPTGCRGEVYYGEHQATLVIHRKFQSPKVDKVSAAEEPFGRATNMKMISFTDRPEYPKVSPPSSEDSVKEAKLADTSKPGTVNLTVNPGHERRDSANYSLPSSGDSDISHS